MFQYYRDLIRYHENVDPGMLLRSINPTEAEFIDVAAVGRGAVCIDTHLFLYMCQMALFLLMFCFMFTFQGIHIRFRLGGAKFPPNILYKVRLWEYFTDILLRFL